MGRRFPAALAGAFALLLALVLPAFAHPHIFIDAKAAIVFNDAGDVVAIRHQWTFDEAFSAWSIQGMDTNNDGVTSEAELQPLADENMKGLASYNYYTSAGEPGQADLTFHHLPNPRLDYNDQRITLNFGIALDQPHHIQKMLEIGIDDPEYYVAITFAGPQAITLENAPPGCRAVLNPPRDIPAELANRLASIGADVVKLPPDLEAAMRGMQGSIDVTCDYSVAGAKQNPTAEDVTTDNAATAFDAVNAMGSVKPIPFGGPPREVSFLPNTPLVLWIIDEQKQFYQLLTNAMTKLKTDNSAFWLLGTVSFLYGIFHAAGPGHGKVVISSYVLANERQYRQGMMLSFTSAMLGSLVAVVFILFAALVLNLTGDAMGNVANWAGIGSYLMVALLGLWLMIRHVFGLGHRHHHHDEVEDDRHDRELARRHLFADVEEDDDAYHRHHDAAGLSSRPSVLARAFETSSRLASAHDHHADHDHGHSHHDHQDHHDDHDDHAGHDHSGHSHDHGAHSHVAVTPDQIRSGNWREALGVVLSIGLRPCSGALVVMVFALSQGVIWAGVASVFLMGVGTALTVAVLATIAVMAKGLAKRLSRTRSRLIEVLAWWAQLTAAFMVFAFGLLLAGATLWG